MITIAASSSSMTTTVTAGLTFLAMAARTMASPLPAPAAPITRATSSSGLSSHPSIGWSRSRNARNRIRNPDSQRGPQLARSAKATAGGIWVPRR